jgi:hypothetical protein
MEHFVLGCRCLETVRNPVLHELVTNKLKECDIDFWQLNETKKIQLILDSTNIGKTRKITSASAQRVELLGFRTVSKQRHPRTKCSIVSSFSLHSKQVASVSVLYIRILLLCSIYDPVSNLSFSGIGPTRPQDHLCAC